MAADRVICAVLGHKWDWRAARAQDGDVPYRCERCRHYDDEPKIKRAAKRRAWINAWAPLMVKLTRRELTLRVGIPYHHKLPSLSLTGDLHFGFEHEGELPGISVRLHVWRLRAGLTIGGMWQDEDGDGRALFRTWLDFTTYGWRWIGCWFGHRWEASDWNEKYVYCKRCDEPGREPESLDTKAAA